MEKDKTLNKEDYVEPNCVLCEKPYGIFEDVKPIPQKRIIDKMNEYMSSLDYNGAERHLKYWLEEAKLGNDKKGELMIYNELIGHYRKVQNKEAFLESKAKALELIDILQFSDSISAGTTYINIATAHSSFSENEDALFFFEKAKTIYESTPNVQPIELAGLYNNMGIALTSLKQFDNAFSSYNKAINILEKEELGALEIAMTYLNIANLYEAKYGLENCENKIYDCCDKAYEYFNDERVPRDGYYAYVCKNSYPTFEYYGFFFYASELKERMEKIYAGT